MKVGAISEDVLGYLFDIGYGKFLSKKETISTWFIYERDPEHLKLDKDFVFK